MKKTLMCLLMLVALLPATAQIRGNNIVVTVEPDHQDWNYKVGETAHFIVEVRRSGTLLDNVSIDYAAGPEMYQTEKKSLTLQNGTLKLSGSMKSAGFYRVDVTAHVDGKNYKGACNAAFSPEKLQPSTVMPSDFKTFWNQAITEARYTPLEPTMRLLPERCTKDVNVYEVSFNNARWDSRTYGILCMPVKEGKYPALLRVPGAGARPYQGDVWTASQGVVTLEIGIHGIPVTLEQKVYDNLNHNALSHYWDWGMDDRNQSYYKTVILGCIRAVDYIEQYTPWNGELLGVTGSSQGGFLSLVTAGLDKRVTCYAPVHAALCDHTNSLNGKACGWPHYFYWNKGKGMEKQIETSRYYDGVNFARLISPQQKGWFSFGYNDDVVPPTSSWATYNTVTGPKEISVYQQTAHFWYQEQWDEWEAWLLKELKVKAQQLSNRLNNLQQKGYMFGHQDDPFYGLTWAYEKDSSDVKNVCGDWPAVMGFELGGIEMGDEKSLDDVPFSKITEEVIKHYERGGIVTISWHPRNPLTTKESLADRKAQPWPQGSAWDVKNTTVVKSILPGGKNHEKFQVWMQRVSDFLATLKTKDGQPIPIIWRPWHENTGSWFWWGEKLCTAEEYKALWNMLQDKLNADGFDNLLWAYSPGMAPDLTKEKYLERYPGDDRIQLVGIDGYQWGTKEDFVSQLDQNLDMLTKFAKERGKIAALTECGLKNLTDPTWWTSTLKPVLDKYTISYFLVWRNYKEEWFGPSPSKPDAPYFRELYDAKNTLFLKDIQ
ncbi:MAG: acetylxylan esterase [Prevotella sp.]|nr:acetylxylan esterase [Prevotella sp.]